MFISIEQIKRSLRKIENYHMFYGTTFLVFKKAQLPIGETGTFAIDSEERKFLDEFYKPKRSSGYYYRPMRSTQKDRLWLDAKYPGAGSQSTRTRGKIAAAFLHESNTQIWGWKKDYTVTLKSQLGLGGKISVFDLAIWLYRERDWSQEFTAKDVIDTFLLDFLITEQEIEDLFDVSIPQKKEGLFQDRRITWDELEEIVGSPPDSLPGEGGTLTFLELHGVGPANQIEFTPAERLNLITGDNGLGKTFILECAWWALTGQWSSYPAYPRQGSNPDNTHIAFAISGSSKTTEQITIKYSRSRGWVSPKKRPTIPGLLVYARVDSSFAVWDPERFDNGDDLPQSLIFSKDQVWQGLTEPFHGGLRSYSEGLLRDWVRWQENPRNSPFYIFTQVLRRLSPNDMGVLEPGPPIRTAHDVKLIPTLTNLYGLTPIIYAAAGIKRIVAMAYFIVWAWSEHQKLANDHSRVPQRRMVILIDEIEAHLHPKWQRLILPALLDVSKDLSSDLEIQFIIATHSPLVMASAEPYFNSTYDKLFHLHLKQRNLLESDVYLEELPFIKYGPVDSWLMSDVFELTSPRSLESEEVIQKAMALQQKDEATTEDIRAISDKLRILLAPDDEFWPLWKYFAEQHGVQI